MKYDPILNLDSTQLFAGKAVSLSKLTDCALAVVKFDLAESRVNLLSSEVMAELAQVLSLLEQDAGKFKGAVFVSGKPDNFIAGADIKEILKARQLSPEVALSGCQDGKALLARISALPFATVAAIHGRCLGGGCELTLACSERIASDSKKTVLGLPEVGLGVLPGWGGTVRAPLLVGFAPALTLILNPLAPWSSRKAYKRGLVSEVVSEDRLFDRACELALGAKARPHKPSLIQRLSRKILDSKPARFVVGGLAASLLELKLGKNYPAPRTAVLVMNAAFELPESNALRLESSMFSLLCHSDACGKSVQKFLDYQKAKKANAAS